MIEPLKNWSFQANLWPPEYGKLMNVVDLTQAKLLFKHIWTTNKWFGIQTCRPSGLEIEWTCRRRSLDLGIHPLTFFLTSLRTFWPSIWHSIWHQFFWHSSNLAFSIWHSMSHLCWHSAWYSMWHSVWHSLWHVFRSRRGPLHPELAIGFGKRKRRRRSSRTFVKICYPLVN